MSVAALSRHFREVGEVYVLIDGDEVVYVGASNNCLGRIAAHCNQPPRKPHLPDKQFDGALWMPLPEVVLPDYEGCLIRAFLPKYNSGAPLDRGNDEEIMNGLDIGHLAGRDWRSHFEAIRRGRNDPRYGNQFGKRTRRG